MGHSFKVVWWMTFFHCIKKNNEIWAFMYSPLITFYPGIILFHYSTILAIFHNLLPGGKLEEEELFIFIIFLRSLFISSLFTIIQGIFFYCFTVYILLLSPATAQNALLVASKNHTKRKLKSTFVFLL